MSSASKKTDLLCHLFSVLGIAKGSTLHVGVFSKFLNYLLVSYSDLMSRSDSRKQAFTSLHQVSFDSIFRVNLLY